MRFITRILPTEARTCFQREAAGRINVFWGILLNYWPKIIMLHWTQLDGINSFVHKLSLVNQFSPLYGKLQLVSR